MAHETLQETTQSVLETVFPSDQCEPLGFSIYGDLIAPPGRVDAQVLRESFVAEGRFHRLIWRSLTNRTHDSEPEDKAKIVLI